MVFVMLAVAGALVGFAGCGSVAETSRQTARQR
jgi:hypothetical protein